jgi:hypothetical protein
MSYEYVSNRPVCHLFSSTCFLLVTCFLLSPVFLSPVFHVTCFPPTGYSELIPQKCGSVRIGDHPTGTVALCVSKLGVWHVL